jgi:hypothetical protein
MTTDKILALVLDYGSAIQARNLSKSHEAYAAIREALESQKSCMAAVRRLLSRDPSVPAELAINMIDAVAPEPKA